MPEVALENSACTPNDSSKYKLIVPSDTDNPSNGKIKKDDGSLYKQFTNAQHFIDEGKILLNQATRSITLKKITCDDWFAKKGVRDGLETTYE